jgi:hypothetical protein
MNLNHVAKSDGREKAQRAQKKVRTVCRSMNSRAVHRPGVDIASCLSVLRFMCLFAANLSAGNISRIALENCRLTACAEAIIDRVNEHGTYYTVSGAATVPNGCRAVSRQARLAFMIFRLG